MIKRYLFLIVLAALILTGIYQVGSQYLAEVWQRVFLAFALCVAWIPLFWRWLWAIILDPRDALGISDAG